MSLSKELIAIMKEIVPGQDSYYAVDTNWDFDGSVGGDLYLAVNDINNRFNCVADAITWIHSISDEIIRHEILFRKFT